MKILLGVGGILLILLLIPVRVTVRRDAAWSAAIGYGGLRRTLLPRPKKVGSKEKKPKKAPSDTSGKDAPPQTEWTLRQWMDLAQELIPRCADPIRRLLRRTTLAKVKLSMRVVGEDAADTALSYGRANAVVYNALAVLDRIVTLRVQKVELIPDFTGGKSTFLLTLELRILPLAVIVAAFQLVGSTLAALRKTTRVHSDQQPPKEGEVKHGQ